MDFCLNTSIRNFQLHMRHEHRLLLNGVFYEFPDEEKSSISSLTIEFTSKEHIQSDPLKLLIESSFNFANQINSIPENATLIQDFPLSPTDLNIAIYQSDGAHMLWKGEYKFINDPGYSVRSYIKSISKDVDNI